MKTIERAEAAPIADRRSKLLLKVTRVAERAWATVEDKLDGANLAQATICAGIATEKMILLGGEPNLRLEISSLQPPIDIYAEFRASQAKIVQLLREVPPVGSEVMESGRVLNLHLETGLLNPPLPTKKRKSSTVVF